MSEQQELVISDAAKSLRTSRASVRQWCESGLIDGAYQLPNGHWRIPPAAVELLKRDGMPTKRRGRKKQSPPSDLAKQMLPELC